MAVKIVATHPNADMDAFGAMVALRLVHPDLTAWFPGAQEVTLRTLLQGRMYHLPEVSTRELEHADIREVFLVDIDGIERLGPLKEIILKRRLPLTAFDHHPGEPRVPDWARVHTLACGSVSTLLTHWLMERRVPIPSIEASLILMGIYEDTGNFRFLETTAKDFQAAAHLLACGADLTLMRRYLVQELNADQMAILDRFVQDREVHVVNGFRVTLGMAALRKFVEDVAFVVHRFVEMMGEEIFLALVEQEGKVYVIGRSRHPRVDISEIVRELGGGGHPGAASAIVKGRTLIEVKERLLEILRRRLPSRTEARTIMTPRVHTVEPKTRVIDALEKLNLNRINALPVVEGDRPLGAVTRQLVDRAIGHGLAGAACEDIMEAGIPVVDPGTPLESFQEEILERGKRFVLVQKGGALVGIITRMDIFRSLLGQEAGVGERLIPRVVEVRKNLENRMPQSWLERMRALGETAEALGMKAWLVGGIVRDLMLSLPLGDVDVVVEGQGIRLGRALEERLGGRFHPHEKFLTGVWVFPDGSRMDIATARRETYARPGALPEVEASALKHDLYRRDFSVNTLVIALNPGEFGKLMDHFGGLQDLKQRTIRVLHSLSFIEDPTRAFRAVRLCERLNFKLSSDTEKLLRVALKNRVFDHLSGFRLWEELALLLDLPDAYRAMERLEGLGLLSALHPRLALSAETQALFLSAQEVLHWAHIEGIGPEHPAVFAMLSLLRHLDDGELPAVASRFAFDGGRRALVEDHRRVARDLNIHLYRAELPSQIYVTLRGLDLPFILWGMAAGTDAVQRDKIKLYLTKLRRMGLVVKGRDLLAKGAPAGPRLKEALEKTLLAKMDGYVETREEEMAFALRSFDLKI